MPKLQFTANIEGPEGKFSEGQVAEVSDAAAERLLEAGFAVSLDEPEAEDEPVIGGDETPAKKA